MRKTKYLKSNMNNSNFNSETQICNQRWARNFFGRLLGLKFVRALNNYSKWRRFWTSPVQVTKNLESSRLACTGIPSTTGSPKITKRSPNVERNKMMNTITRDSSYTLALLIWVTVSTHRYFVCNLNPLHPYQYSPNCSSINFSSCWHGEFDPLSRPSLNGDHFPLFSRPQCLIQWR